MNRLNFRSKQIVTLFILMILVTNSLANTISIYDQIKYNREQNQIEVTNPRSSNRVRIFKPNDLGVGEFNRIVQDLMRYEANAEMFKDDSKINESNQSIQFELGELNRILNQKGLSNKERKQFEEKRDVLRKKIVNVHDGIKAPPEILGEINWIYNSLQQANRITYPEQAFLDYIERMFQAELTQKIREQLQYELAVDSNYQFNAGDIQSLIGEALEQVKTLSRSGFSFAPLAMDSDSVLVSTVKDPNKMIQTRAPFHNNEKFEELRKVRTLQDFLQVYKFEGVTLEAQYLEPSSLKGKQRVRLEYIYELSEKVLNSQELTQNEKMVMEKIFVSIPEMSDRKRFFSLLYSYKIRKDLEQSFLDSMSSMPLKVLKLFIFHAFSHRINSVGNDHSGFFTSNYNKILNARSHQTLRPYLKEAIQQMNNPEKFFTEVVVPLYELSRMLDRKEIKDIAPILFSCCTRNIDLSQIKEYLNYLYQRIESERKDLVETSPSNPELFKKLVAKFSELFPVQEKLIKSWAIFMVEDGANSRRRTDYYSYRDIKLAEALVNGRDELSNSKANVCLKAIVGN